VTTWNSPTPKIQGRGIQDMQPAGHCVLCKHVIPRGEPYIRIPGVLGKVCLECAP
jgi:hypothetical protein